MAVVLEAGPTIPLGYRMAVVFHMTLAGAAVTGLTASLNVWRSKAGESPATQIVTAGSGRTLTEIDATNQAGAYRMRLDAADVDTRGQVELVFKAAGADDHHVTLLIGSIEWFEGRDQGARQR